MLTTRYFSLLLLVLFTSGCDLGGYHSMGQFPDRLTAEQKMLEHLLSEYDELGSGDYKLIYQFPEKQKELKYAIWYDKELGRLGVENDIYSGPCCVWVNVDQAVLRDLVAEKKGILNADSLSERIHPDLGPCRY
ncbi:hypothetical protein [Salmonirosea aquatica]|uniref:Uncharacterized protein n=1 Tax=Salmonirosea aquatica TaxID=2654236 RepID=A0A7C9FCF9_9BACT|nr:hypothetical protein [Cytophagaceae bacterium SJW1-29]